MPEQKRLFLLDAYALIFRGYYALIKNPRINSKGEDTSAVMGFTNSLFDVIKRENPDHLAVCFDKDGSKERKEIFEDYKANRDETPDVIRESIPIIKSILKAMHIPVVELSGLEADDIIGTLSKQAEKENYKVFMVTPDKDFGQLVSENIFMYRPARMGNAIEIWGIPEVQKRFGVDKPEQVIDYLGMMGDASDNIPGLPGVGDKTAKKFIKQFGSLEGLLDNTDQLKGKMKEKVEDNAELGRMSKKLAAIFTECDVKFDAEDYELSKPDVEKVIDIFKDLEFRRLTEQFLKMFNEGTDEKPKTVQEDKDVKQTPGAGQYSLFGNNTDKKDVKAEDFQGYKTLKHTDHHYQYVDTPKAIEILMDKLSKQSSVCFDTETTSLNTLDAKLVGIAFSWQSYTGFYVPFPEDEAETQKRLQMLKPFFENEDIEKVGQNLKYDIKVLKQHGIDVKGKLFDTMLAHYIINPDMRHNMDVLAETYLNYSPQSIEELIGKPARSSGGKGKNQGSMRDVELEKITKYAVEDADITFQLKRFFEEELTEAHNQPLFDKLEIPLIRVLADMETEGIKVDESVLKDISKSLEEDIEKLEKAIHEQAGEEFNIGSPKQLGEILFGKLQIAKKPKKTKSGQYSTAEEVLSFHAKEHKIAQDVLDWRGLTKLKNTYVDALPKQIHKKTGRIHTEFMQTVAATGRLSSTNPNLQNIPIRTERGRLVRKAFVPKNDDYTLLAADYSQIELRIIAALSKEETMIKAFQNGEDIHASTAAKIFDIELDEVTREQRSQAKTVNFGIIYGVSAFGLSNQTDLSRSESKDLIETYYKTYPKLRAYMDEQVEFAREHEYVKTVMGRRRYLKDINASNGMVRSGAERNAVNAPIQGSAADIIKVAMINIHKKLNEKNYKSKMLLQVHDELIFDVYKPELEELQDLIKTEMENAYKLDVPLEVEIGTGQNWLEAH